MYANCDEICLETSDVRCYFTFQAHSHYELKTLWTFIESFKDDTIHKLRILLLSDEYTCMLIVVYCQTCFENIDNIMTKIFSSIHTGLTLTSGIYMHVHGF